MINWRLYNQSPSLEGVLAEVIDKVTYRNVFVDTLLCFDLSRHLLS